MAEESHGWRRPMDSKRYWEAIAQEQPIEKEAEEEEEEEEVACPSSKTSNKKMNLSTPAPLAEHRLAPFLPKPTSQVVDRISRAFTHRLYLIDKKPSADSAPSSCDFIILGATGNVYTVKLDLIPSCTCPDHAQGNTCKHILFVMLRVLKLPRDDPRVLQKALLPSELHPLLHNLSINDSILASKRIRQHFIHLTRDTAPASSSEETSHLKPGQRAIDGDCPICYEPMVGGTDDGKPVEPVVFCKACGNNVHTDCFKRWSQSKGHSRVTCIYCRAQWRNDDEKRSHDGYINLAAYSEWHGQEATSPEVLYPESYC